MILINGKHQFKPDAPAVRANGYAKIAIKDVSVGDSILIGCQWTTVKEIRLIEEFPLEVTVHFEADILLKTSQYSDEENGRLHDKMLQAIKEALNELPWTDIQASITKWKVNLF